MWSRKRNDAIFAKQTSSKDFEPFVTVVTKLLNKHVPLKNMYKYSKLF